MMIDDAVLLGYGRFFGRRLSFWTSRFVLASTMAKLLFTFTKCAMNQAESSRTLLYLISCCNYQRNMAGFKSTHFSAPRTSFLGLIKKIAQLRTV
jgi:hypothetical protein